MCHAECTLPDKIITEQNFIATFRVARLTFQTRKLWLVGVATDRDARHACLRFFSFSCFFLLAFLFICIFSVFFASTEKSKIGLQGVPSETARKVFFEMSQDIVQQLEPKQLENKLNPGP